MALRRITMWIDCDDKDAEVVARRILTYLTSLGALNVEVVKIENLKGPPLSNK
jgi:hypothetical protein